MKKELLKQTKSNLQTIHKGLNLKWSNHYKKYGESDNEIMLQIATIKNALQTINELLVEEETKDYKGC